MKPLTPNGKIDLEHRAYFLRGSSDHLGVIAASEEGHVTLLELSTNSTRHQRPTKKLRAISPHPTEPAIAFVDGNSGSLVVQNLAGKKVVEIESPCIATDGSSSIGQGFADCYFDEGGDFLWLVAPLSVDECELTLVETKGWSVVQKAVLEDPFGASDCSFHPAGNSGLVSLWIAAGQDGQQVYWLKRKGVDFSVKKVDELTNCIPPVFSPDGSEFLVVTEDNSISRFAFPSLKHPGSPFESGDEDNPFTESLCYLDDRNALASTGEGRIFLVDTTKMRIEEEIALEGHEPRPIGEYYPSLSNEQGLGTDISWFTKIGNVIVFIYRRDRGTGLKGWRDSLLWCLGN